MNKPQACLNNNGENYRKGEDLYFSILLQIRHISIIMRTERTITRQLKLILKFIAKRKVFIGRNSRVNIQINSALSFGKVLEKYMQY